MPKVINLSKLELGLGAFAQYEDGDLVHGYDHIDLPPGKEVEVEDRFLAGPGAQGFFDEGLISIDGESFEAPEPEPDTESLDDDGEGDAESEPDPDQATEPEPTKKKAKRGAK